MRRSRDLVAGLRDHPGDHQQLPRLHIKRKSREKIRRTYGGVSDQDLPREIHVFQKKIRSFIKILLHIMETFQVIRNILQRNSTIILGA